LAQETLRCPIKARLRITGESNRESGIHKEPAGAKLDACGDRHKIEGLLPLRNGGSGYHQSSKNYQTKTSHRGACSHVCLTPFTTRTKTDVKSLGVWNGHQDTVTVGVRREGKICRPILNAARWLPKDCEATISQPELE
jgi:hypothetical protein